MLERVMIVGGTGGGDRVAAGALDVEANDDGHVKMTRDVCMQKHEVLVKRAVLMKHEFVIIPECSMEHAVFMKHEVLKIPECSMVLEILGAIAYRFSVTPSRTPMLDWGEDWLASSSSRQLNALSFHVCAMPKSIYRCYSRPFLFSMTFSFPWKSVFLRGFQSLMGAQLVRFSSMGELFPIVFPRVFKECVFLYCVSVISMGARAVIPVIFDGCFCCCFRTCSRQAQVVRMGVLNFLRTFYFLVSS